MSMYILPGIMTVDDVNNVSEEILKELTSISTGIILKRINEFVDKNKNSSDANVAKAANKLYNVYKDLNDFNEYLNSDEAKNLADTLVSLQYSDISATTDIRQLKLWRLMIIELLSEDKDFVESYKGEISTVNATGYKTAYTARLDKDNFQITIDKMYELAGSDVVSLQLIHNINKMKNLFKNGTHNINKPTVFRKAIYAKDRLRNILKGLDFLIPRLESNTNPMTWRRL